MAELAKPRGWTRRALELVLASSSLLGSTGCGDPVIDDAIALLGPEVKGIKEGPLHRPGQPCVLCHSAGGSADPEFSLGGTLYRTRDALEPLAGAKVRFIDFEGLQFAVTTNKAGNFYARRGAFKPAWPVWVQIDYQGENVEMTSAVQREGSCAHCHEDPASPSSVGHVYLWQTEPRATGRDAAPATQVEP